MKHTTAILASALGFSLAPLNAQNVPLFINYQGRVTDSAGVGLGTGTPVNRRVIFRIFDAANAGNRLWSEQHTVTISNGEFSVLLGNGIDAVYNSVTETPARSTRPLDTVFTSSGSQRFVEIVVDNGDNTLNNADAAVSPRQQITSTAYSFRAASAERVTDGAITSAMLASGAALSNIAINTIDNTKLAPGAAVANIADNSIGSGKLAPGAALANIAANSIGSGKLDPSIGLWSASGSNVFRASGNVGIGVANPQAPLTFTGAVGQAISLTNNGQSYGLALQPGILQINSPADISLGVGPSASMRETMRLSQAGTVTIGAVTIFPGNTLPYEMTVLGDGDNGRGNVYMIGRCTARGYITFSDERLKSIVARSNPPSDLNLIQKLQVTDYLMIDRAPGVGVQKGFIAQEVQKIMPEAVNKLHRQAIPNILAPATKATFDPSTKTLRVVLEKAHGLKKGDAVQVKADKKSREVNVIETIDPMSFVAGPVEGPMSEVFVYGKVVDDVLAVDYHQLFTAGIGAIQDLASQVEAIKAENAELRTKLAALEADGAASNAKMDALEKLVHSIKQPAVRTVSLKAGE